MIAIIGMHCRVPGASSVDELWSNLRAGIESITQFTDEELLRNGVDAERLADPDYVKARGVIDDIEFFDAAFFGYTPREAELLDPQHRLFLECAWQALETAGYLGEQTPRIGVFAGCGANTYLLNNISADRELLRKTDYHKLLIGNDKDFLAPRVSYKLDLRGPSVNVSTACSTSLVAVHAACQSILAGECDVAIAGGVSIPVPHRTGYLYQESGILSPDGRCRAFDANARGTAVGAGAAIVVLKRLDDAAADRDRVYAIIRGSAINNDGSLKAGFTAPSVQGQAEVIAEAMAVAEVEPKSIQYVEAHGTGTQLGDPIELAALTKAFRGAAKNSVAIGSIKTNIGHLDAAAGAIGLIKAALALHHQEIPPSLHFTQANPEIDFVAGPFYVNTKLTPWSRNGAPRRAGVSSFGLGGTNAHVVLEEAEACEESGPSARPEQLLVWSAATAVAAFPPPEAKAATAVAALHKADAAYTLALGRKHFPHRAALVGDTIVRGTADRARGVAFLFPGGGAQFAGMGRDLYTSEPVYRDAIDRCTRVLPIDFDDAMARPSNAMVSLFATEYAMAQLLLSWGITPRAMIGHSLGEYTAACIAGVWPLEDCLALVALRGRLLESMPPGAMLSVKLAEDEIALEDGLSIAAVNAHGSCVVTGAVDAIARFDRALTARGVETRRVHIDAAAHSPMVDAVLGEFRAFAATLRFAPPSVRWVSNLTGSWITDEQAVDPRYWCRHFRETVRFADGVQRLFEDPDTILVEVGPGQTLVNLAAQHPKRPQEQLVAATMRHPQEPGSDSAALLAGIGRLWTNGVAIDWRAFFAHEKRRRVALPTYPFQRQRYWIDPPGIAKSDVEQTSREPRTRTENLRPAIRNIVARITGLQSIPDDASFFELGLDSLTLVQISREVKSELGVKLALRQFLEELTTVAKLAEYVAQAPSVRPSETKETKKAPLHFSSTPDTAARGLTAQQQQHLDDLITRYTARTRGSKEHAAQYRPVLADSRAAVGFKPSTKELLYPIVGVRAEGARITDIDGNEYIDLTNAMGVTLFGHAPAFLTDALREHAHEAHILGPRSRFAGEAARLLCELTGMERAAFCNSGTEAVMAAIRLARTHTGRSRIVTFEGAYHGHSDQTLVQPGPEPIAPGIPQEAVANTIVLPWNDPESLEWIRAHGDTLAAVLAEPVQNMHLDVQPAEFLRELREITRDAGVVLIFDEMITGFRLHPGGAQAWLGIEADLATYGKIIGGGMPIGVVAGRAEVMDGIDGGLWNYGDTSIPQAERTFFGGTFCQHPAAMIACVAVLREMQRLGPRLQDGLNRRTEAFARRLNEWLAGEDLPIRIVHCGSAFRFTFTGNLELLFFHLLLRGVYLWEWRGCFLSLAHTEEDLDRVFLAVQESVAELRSGGYLPPRELPLTPAQRQLWRLSQQDSEGALAYKTALSLELRGALDVDALRTATRSLSARHEALRTVVPNGDMQRVSSSAGSTPQSGCELQVVSVADVDQWFAEKNAAPMDLAHGPLFLAHLLRLEEERHILVLTAHHIVTDGWSMTNLVHELMALYSGQTDAPPPMQFRQYAAWQAELLGSDVSRAQETWWLEQLRDLPPPPELPYDRPRPARRSYASRRRTRTIDAAQASRIRAFCKAHDCTLFMFLYAAYVALLQRISGGDDLIVGVSASGRGLEGSDSLVGYCTHILPVRNTVDRNDSFAAFLDATRARLLAAYDRQDVPFAVVLEKLRDKRVVSLTFNLDKPVPMPAARGLQFALYTHPVHYSDFELMVNVIDVDGKLIVDCDYSTDLFDASTIDTLLDGYGALLDSAVTNPEERIARLALSSRPTLVTLFERSAAQDPGATALTFAGRNLTYAELDARANQVAQTLGPLAPDTLVAITLEPSFEMIAAILGILKAGGAYVPIDPASPSERIAFLLEDSRAALTIDGAFMRRAAEAPSAKLDVRVEPHHAAYVIYTSGSTGKPKGVVVEHAQVVRLFTSTQDWFAFGRQDVWTLFHSYAFDFSVWEIFGALLYGGRLVIVPYEITRSPRDFHRLLFDEGVTVLNQTPSAFRHISEATDAGALRLIIFGGEALDLATLTPWFERFGDARPRLVNMYGITETTVHVTYRPLTREDAARGGSRIGVPIPDLTLHVLDEELQPVPNGITGELFVGGAGVARGYLRRDELTRERFLERNGERLYRSGDLVRRTADGDLEYRGRRDAQLKVRGFRIEPGEIESTLRAHPAVRDAVVVLHGETLIAYYVADEELDLRAHAACTLTEQMVPAAFVRMDAFPLTRNGKLDRRALPPPSIAESAYVAPRNDTETALAAIWSELLHVERVGVHDNFFELGGDSITGMQVAMRALEAGIAISPRDVHRNPTIAALALCPSPGASRHPLPAPRGEGQSLLPAELWLASQHQPDPDAYTMALPLEIAPDADPARLEHALHTVAAHHGLGDALRFTIRPARLDLSAHHSFVDGVSWRILIGDLELAYRGEALPSNSASRHEWAAALEAAARAGAFDDELAYWQTLPDPRRLRCDFLGDDAGLFESEDVVPIDADAELLPKQRIDETLLGALAQAIEPTVIDVETHGREELVPGLGTARTVGWLTAIHPRDLAQPRERVPRNGAAFLALEQYGRIALPKRDILFNYLGRFDRAPRGALVRGIVAEPPSGSRGARNKRSHLLEINAFVADGRLHAAFAYSITRHRRESIERIAGAFAAALTRVAVPLPDSDLSDDQLKRALAAIR